ncbi:MAG: hypothetical protein KIT14_13100 [bacterium]|nr:hypothetical protein [bacterium]
MAVAGLVLAHGACSGPAAQAAESIAPKDVAVAAGGGLLVGNAVRVVVGGTAVNAPIAARGSVVLDERAVVGDVHAGMGFKAKLLARVSGDVVVRRGGLQISNQVQVSGALLVSGPVVLGLGARVAGAVVSADGSVKIGRLADVDGDVYAGGDLRGDKDARVGSAGTVVAVRGDAVIRDRSDWWGTIRHAGSLRFLGGRPRLHGGVEPVAASMLPAPADPDWTFAGSELRVAPPGRDDVVVASGTTRTLEPGAWGTLTLAQRATVRLQPGAYAFAGIAAASDARVVVDPGVAPARVTIDVRGAAQLGRRVRMTLVAGTPLEAASRIVTRSGGPFRLDQDGVWIGTVRARTGLVFGKHVSLTGAAWSASSVQVGRDSVVAWVPNPDAW